MKTCPASKIAPDQLSKTLGSVALRLDSPFEKNALFQAAGELQARAKRNAQSVLELPETATLVELNRARRMRSVRRGKHVYLPIWKTLNTGMPNVLLRSALWSVRKRHDEPIAVDSDADGKGNVIPSLGDVTLINRGPVLNAYDRRVFAACLDHYRDEPLSPGEDSSWIEVSYWKFLSAIGTSYHIDSHHALRASLERLSSMSLLVRHQGFEVHLPRIVEVTFAYGTAGSVLPRASDVFLFRILAPFAELYGGAKWTSVSHDSLNAGMGLKSWLACFYSTHVKPFETKLSDLHKLSGSTAPLSKFKGQLKAALNGLMSDDQPLSSRIKSYNLDEKSLTVVMAIWPAHLQQ